MQVCFHENTIPRDVIVVWEQKIQNVKYEMPLAPPVIPTSDRT